MKYPISFFAKLMLKTEGPYCLKKSRLVKKIADIFD